MASQGKPTTMENLPDGVLSEIFIRLLAKQLAQMRCMCKPWNLLLSESSFVKSHLHHSIDKNNDEILLFFLQGFSFDCSKITARPSHSPDLELKSFIKLPVNRQSKNSQDNVIGSVNGLICFSYGSYPDNYGVHIWNPSLSLMLTLPPCSLPSSNTIKIHLRFGYDPKTNDYKVVKHTSPLMQTGMLPQVEVYSMRKGSWDLISQRLPSHITWIKDQDKVCVDGHDGHLHWLGYTDTDKKWKPKMIVAFDLGTETFHEIPLPDSILDCNVHCRNVLGVLSRKLCVISKVLGGRKCEVWVMDEYGLPESWAKLHVLSLFSRDITPYGFTSRNEFLFRVDFLDNGFVLYDPVSSKGKSFKILPDSYAITKIVEYADSLVWVAPTMR